MPSRSITCPLICVSMGFTCISTYLLLRAWTGSSVRRDPCYLLILRHTSDGSPSLLSVRWHPGSCFLEPYLEVVGVEADVLSAAVVGDLAGACLGE